MGQVYLAKDNKFSTRKVAVKTVRQDILNSDDLEEGEAIARFEREAQAAASIQHPNTVSVTDFGETIDGVFYLVMEYVEGETLHKLLRREGTLPVSRAVILLRQIADGVCAAHELGILHRDLKPANIFIMQTGRGDGFVKVGDFGLAKIVSQTVADAGPGSAPSSRGIVGTPEFMSPEQMQPELGIDVRSDLYALGTIAYLMLGGRTPFSGDMMQLVMQKVMHPAPPISSLRTDIPIPIAEVIMRALETDPNKRPATVAEWMDELEKAAAGFTENKTAGTSRLVILAPVNAEVYIDDERKASVGSSGRVVLTDVPIGQHVLRVSRAGDRDDERVIEVRAGNSEQVIEAKLRPERESSSQPTPSADGSLGAPAPSVMPEIVICRNCGARFALGVKFCGRCGGAIFDRLQQTAALGGQTVCRQCGNRLTADSKFCGRCGHNISPRPATSPQMPFYSSGGQSAGYPTPTSGRICRRCGTSFPPNIKFCGRCGVGL
jgi:serine/threonine-protein kinase